jgi:hypothetical protein
MNKYENSEKELKMLNIDATLKFLKTREYF